jgi:3-hydroxymyristoyl/3-hydroxydecanoyl-(acyl carrier protein) dehydratase
MDLRFAAFSFVDAIDRLEPGARARGRYTVPAALPGFPVCLVAEAIGQLAAWAAMAAVAFRGRPVAALAGEARFHAGVLPGQTLELAVELERCGEDAMTFAGTAHVAGAPVAALARCGGPMLPVEELDAPEALRADLARLTSTGAPAGRLRALPELPVTADGGEPGQWQGAELWVPVAAPFLADHFPRRPVLPGSLLLESQLQLGGSLAGAALGLDPAVLAPVCVRDVKLRGFVAPGSRVALRADVRARGAGSITLELAARVDGRAVATGRAEYAIRGLR